MSDEFRYNPEVYSEEQLDIIESHIQQHFGEYENVFHELFSPDIHLDICIIPPNEERDYYTLVTMGMGAHKMNVPEKFEEYKLERAELVICLPPDWNVESSDEKDFWPIGLIKRLARLPINCDTWLAWGHTIDNEESFAENTEFCGSMILSPPFSEECRICELPNGEEVNFYQVFPLYQSEMQFKLDHSLEELIEVWGDDLNHIINIEREPAIEYSESIIVDTMDWHVDTISEKNLPLDEIAGINHMAIYLRWCIENNLMCDAFEDCFSEILEDVRTGETTDLREFIRDELDGNITRDMFNDVGELFAEYYYNHENETDAPCYPQDIDDHAVKYFTKQGVELEQFKDEEYLFVPFDEKYYNDMKVYIEYYYSKFNHDGESSI